MRTIPLILPVALAGLLAAGTTTHTATSTTAQHMALTSELLTSKPVRVQYLLDLPKGYEAHSGKRWPLILFLHGAGERGDDVQKAAVHGPPKVVRNGTDLPFAIVTPLCPAGQRWSNEILLALLDEVLARHAIDTGRVYLTGLSMGGYGTWSLGLANAGRFAAIAPICGGGQFIDVLLPSGDKAGAFRTLGVWAFHGAKDPVVPLQESERMVNYLKNVGCQEVKFTVYPETQHDSWTETYRNPELYEWFLRHERPVGK